MSKSIFVFIALFMIFSPGQVANAQSIKEVEGLYVTTEDIISDILFPTIDKRVMKEYGQDSFYDWQWKGIVGITYNDNHSYDIQVKIEIPADKMEDFKEDLVKIKVFPSCDSEKINQEKCNHGFKIEILDYQHLSP
ncbi:DUF3888 domain-containing protein [Lysinibacillus sp. BW-2-10]|uniref:DUF3888 domain-containing protein n=1 Tax=Lysinibacillus sp. BW-2-10 TaxID=2590030 RepID=UPI001180617D|nr:DUF3888 domain-containing protein [Lysinibacillus sp. BW-2-10]TSI05150.1 DUF3888 domain-containing protein [Lysinibacillus sp. BW-2-10]